jgi:4'-phosphopantetheinyl transferase
MKDSFVEIWHGDILTNETETDVLSEQLYWSFLNQDEKQKAQAFTQLKLQKKYIKVRGILRKTLASYLNIEPQKVAIKTGEYGKPFLMDNKVYFNLSHSDNQFVIAVSNTGDIGVDLEQCRDRKGMAGIVNKCFSDEEISYWRGLPPSQQLTTFYYFWVRKEAFVKAVGRGIVLGLEQCVINPRDKNQFSHIPKEYGLASSWKIIDVGISEQMPCAVVVKNKLFEYRQHRILP